MKKRNRLARAAALLVKRVENSFHSVARDSAVVLAGHGAQLGLGLISSAILARALGAEGLSLFAVVGAATAMAGTVADFGLRVGAIRYIAPASGATDRGVAQAQETAAAYARWKLVGSVLLTLLVLLAARPLALLLGLPPQAGPGLLRLGALAMLATLLSGLVGTLLHALRRFGALTLAQTANAALTVLLMGALWLAGRLDVGQALLVGGMTAGVAALLGYAMAPAAWRRALRRSVPLGGAHSRRLLSFSRWLWVSNILSIAAVQLDIVLLNQWLAPAAVGIYALARNLAFKADIVNQTLHTVLLPQVSGLEGRGDYVAYARRTLGRGLLLGALMVLALPLARPFIVFVYGSEFAPSAPLFYALMAVVLLDLLASPLVLLALPLNRPRLLAASDGVQVLLLVAVGAAAIPLWGAYGAVLARFIARAGGILVTTAPILRQLRRGAAPAADSAAAPAPRDPT